MAKPTLFIDGEHGTTGLQIRERMADRQDVEILHIAHGDRHDVSKRRELLNEADFAILCLPDAAAREAVAMIESDTRIIDTSTAHRVAEGWTYGFAEALPGQRDRIASSNHVSNPGCYSTGAIGLLAPLVAAKLVPADYPICINAVSGYTGGGKAMIAQMENAKAENHIAQSHFLYALSLAHKHVPEIIDRAGLARKPIFSPAVARFPQGMAVQIPLHMDMTNAKGRSELHSALAKHYNGQSIVRVASLDETNGAARLAGEAFAGTDTMELHVCGNDEQVNLVALLDNLGKGASGAAVQNLDIMIGR
ncbi:MAG: N-acetyl-gamma-glutamyl-phosphate reductase [Pseudomonadota bacterium]